MINPLRATSKGFNAAKSGVNAASKWSATQLQNIWSALAANGTPSPVAQAAGASAGSGAVGNIGCFGPIVFETSLSTVRTPAKWQERRRANYATHNVLSLEQKLQFVTVELAQMEIDMIFHRAFCTPDEELEALRGVLDGHEAHDLIIGTKAFGEFVLEELTNTVEHTNNKGQTLYAETKARLREYR